MILEKDHLLDFEYDITTQILTVSYPNLSGITLSQIKNSLHHLYLNVVNYDIKKLLLDLRAGVLGVTEAQYREMMNVFFKQFSQTRLEKIARVLPPIPEREFFVDHYAQLLQKDVIVNFKDESFTSKAEALAWLME